MAINIDSKIKNTEQVIIGGKTRNIIFNDDFNRKVTDVQLAVSKSQYNFKELDQDELEAMSLDEQKEIISCGFDDMCTAAINFFDQQFGEGAGQEIYNYYHKSSDALAFVIGELYRLSNDIVVRAKNKKKKHYTSNN